MIDWDCTNKLNSLLLSIKCVVPDSHVGPLKTAFFLCNFIHNFVTCIDTTVLAWKFEAKAENESLGFISNAFSFVNLTPNTECTMSSSKGHTAVWKTFIWTQKISRWSLSGFHFPKVQLWVKCANISQDILLKQIKMWISGMWGRRKPFDYRAAEPKMSCLTVLCVYIWQETQRAQLFSSSAVYLSPLTVSTEFFSQ